MGEGLKFEVARSEKGYWARVKTAKNGKIRMHSETVAKKATARKILTDCFGAGATIVEVDER